MKKINKNLNNTIALKFKTLTLFKQIIIAFFITLISNAQSPIIDIEEYSFWNNSQENAYYKDINNYFNLFEGTWLYTNGNTSFKIVLTKETMLYTGSFYTDYLTGEYQYIENGTELRNTLSNTDQYTHGIYGSNLVKSHTYPLCSDCPANERRVNITISDLVRNLYGQFVLKLITVNGQPAIEGLIIGSGVGSYVAGNPPPFFGMIIPDGTYTFIKQ